MMISCDICDVWQHGACVGIYGDEEAPDGESKSQNTHLVKGQPLIVSLLEYYCDECRPAMHAPLKRYMKLRWKDQ
jgi:hypothetical protein